MSFCASFLFSCELQLTKERCTCIQGCIWAAPLGKWRRKITTGALFGKQCARHGALFPLRAHFLKYGAPDFSHVLFRKYCFPLSWSISFFFCLWSALSRLASVRENKGIPLSIFKSGKNQRISFFIENQGQEISSWIREKNQGYMIFFVWFPQKMYLKYKWGFMTSLKFSLAPLALAYFKKSIRKYCIFVPRILSKYSNSYGFIYQYLLFLCFWHYQSWFMEKNQGHNREYNLTRRLFTLTMVVKIGFCLDIGFFLLDIYQWAHWEDLGRTFRKGVRPCAQDFVWPNAPLFLTEMVKRHIYGPRPFIWAYNQVSMTFRSKVLARTKSMTDRQTDGRTDGQTDGRTDTPNL